MRLVSHKSEDHCLIEISKLKKKTPLFTNSEKNNSKIDNSSQQINKLK